MRKLKTHSTMLLMVLSACSLCAAGHSPEQTNALIRTMLRNSLVRVNFDEQTQSFKSMPRHALSQEEFFAPDDEWTSEEKRAAFNWYLGNLSTTAIERGMIAGRLWVDNPVACAAISQCEAMSYTNALPLLIANIGNGFDQSRLSAIRVVINWSSMSNLTELVVGIVTNEPHYAKMERNLAYSLYCTRLNDLAHGLVNTNSELVASGVNAMYARREDPIGAVAVDKLLAALKPGYYNGAERCACALSLLANENSSSECISYFASVTNGLNSADR